MSHRNILNSNLLSILDYDEAKQGAHHGLRPITLSCDMSVAFDLRRLFCFRPLAPNTLLYFSRQMFHLSRMKLISLPYHRGQIKNCLGLRNITLLILLQLLMSASTLISSLPTLNLES